MITCPECRKVEMQPVLGELFDYGQLAGLPYPVLLRGVDLERCPVCGEESVAFPDIEGLHLAIGLSIVNRHQQFVAGEIRFLRKLLDWTAVEMSQVLGVDDKTISRWENGKQAMGPVAERLLRLIVRDLEPRPADWVREVFPRIRRDLATAPSAVRLKATEKGWFQAA